MYTALQPRSPGRRLAGALVLSALALASACGDGTAPTAPEPESPPDTASPPGPVLVTLPTGRLLVVRGDSILLLNAKGGEPTLIAEKARLPSWSPEGSMVAFVPVRDEGEYGPPTLCIAQPDGAGTRCAFVGPTDGEVFQRPSWSPDGRSLAYSTSERPVWAPYLHEISGLRVLDVATMSYRQITRFSVASPSWSPDGNEIALVFGSNPAGILDPWDIRGSLGTVAPDGTGFRSLGDGYDTGYFMEVAWSPSGGHLAFTVAEQVSCPFHCFVRAALAVARFDADPSGGGISPLRVLDSGTAIGLAWAPDETSIAFVDRPACDAGTCSPPDVMAVGVAGDWIARLVPGAHSPAWGR